MERAVALSKLGKILGKSLGYRVDPKAPDQEGRDEARAKLKGAQAVREALGKQKNDRMRELLQGDAEFMRLKAEYDAAGKTCTELYSMTSHYRFTVGISSSMFFHVKAQGDSWEEVIGKLTEKAKT